MSRWTLLEQQPRICANTIMTPAGPAPIISTCNAAETELATALLLQLLQVCWGGMATAPHPPLLPLRPPQLHQLPRQQAPAPLRALHPGQQVAIILLGLGGRQQPALQPSLAPAQLAVTAHCLNQHPLLKLLEPPVHLLQAWVVLLHHLPQQHEAPPRLHLHHLLVEQQVMSGPWGWFSGAWQPLLWPCACWHSQCASVF